jgi:hypothetical protein
MTFRVVNTQSWDYEQLAPYTRQITAYFRKLVDHFPEDLTVQSIGMECIAGARQLWLVFDDEEMVAVCMTQIRTIDATGTKIVTLSSHAGDAGLDCVPDMCRTIEAWAAEQGANFTAAEGRRGWGRELAKQGYREYAVVWRKPIERAA